MSETVAVHRYRECATSLSMTTGVRNAEVIVNDQRLDGHCIEVVVGPDYERVPPRVLGILRDHGLGTRPDLGGSIGPGHYLLVVV